MGKKGVKIFFQEVKIFCCVCESHARKGVVIVMVKQMIVLYNWIVEALGNCVEIVPSKLTQH